MAGRSTGPYKAWTRHGMLAWTLAAEEGSRVVSPHDLATRRNVEDVLV